MEFRKELVALDQRVLIISDLHVPFHHPDSFVFLGKIKKVLNPEIIISLGDELDHASISFHDSDSAMPNADKELEMAIYELQKLKDLFPRMYLCESNHGSLVYRRMKHHGIPLSVLKPLGDLYGTPEWKWFHEIMLETHIGKTLIVHGKSSAYNKMAQIHGCNVAQGHFHSKFEITWQQSSMGSRFNMIAGCLVDEKHLAFSYGKNIAQKPMIGCGFLDEQGEPFLIRMNLDQHGRWTGKL